MSDLWTDYCVASGSLVELQGSAGLKSGLVFSTVSGFVCLLVRRVAQGLREEALGSRLASLIEDVLSTLILQLPQR